MGERSSRKMLEQLREALFGLPTFKKPLPIEDVLDF